MIKELRTEFKGIGEVRGFNFKQIEVSNLGYIYEVSDTFNNRWYEVFKRYENTINSEFVIKETYTMRVPYPGSNSFGIWAWSSKYKQKAYDRFNNFK